MSCYNTVLRVENRIKSLPNLVSLKRERVEFVENVGMGGNKQTNIICLRTEELAVLYCH